MILDHLNNAERYSAVHPGLAHGFRFLASADLQSLPDGRHSIDGDRVFALIARGDGRGREASKLEAHDRYIDIQHVITGTDEIGIKHRAACQVIHQEMDPERDILFFGDEPDFWMSLVAGSFAVFFPEDAHAPLAGAGPVHKVVVKVAFHGW